MIKKLKHIGTLIVLSSTLVFSGCTIKQQDNLFDRAINMARDSAGLEVKVAPAGDVNLTYMERASSAEDSETIILVHGFSSNKDTWIRFADAINEKYRIIAVDLAGHGDSDRSMVSNYDLIEQADRLEVFFNGLDINSFHIVGSSMGGAISLLYSLTHPSKVQSLTLMNSAGIDGDTQSEYFKILAKGENPLIANDEESFEFRMDLTMSQPPFLPWPLKSALLRQTIAREAINSKIFTDMVSTKERLQEENFDAKIKTIMAKNKLPTLIMWGEEDRVLDVSAAAAFKQLIPHAQLHIFEDVGHLPMLEVPQESAEVFQDFISSAQ